MTHLLTDDCLHDLFRTAVLRTPDATAVVYRSKSWTFLELDQQTDQLAGHLHSLGVQPDSIVGIFMDHSFEFVLSYIAILKAGGAYMPIELVYPPELLQRVMEEAQPVTVLTKGLYTHRLPASQHTFDMDTFPTLMPTTSILTMEEVLPTTPDHLGFVVMSSGTTGVPKGICVPHRAATHSYLWRLTAYPYVEEDRVACHVFFVWELLRPLLGNVPLYVIPDEIIYDPTQLIDYLQEHRITRMLFTPSLLQMMVDTVPSDVLALKLTSLSLIWLCGEVVTMELRTFLRDILPKCTLMNLYSVSECHDVSDCDLNTVDVLHSPKYASCGNLIPNVQAYIFSDDMERVEEGELYVAGPCLARGYLNQPEQTAARFISHTIDGVLTRLYKTGDRARFLPNAQLELIGRCDYFVKIRGYSVVLGAVEAALAQHPQVSSCVVALEGEEGAEKRLVAYMVPKEWENIPSSRSVRAFLKSKIAVYAIPSVFLLMDALPINNASGKLDRKRLPPLEEALKLRSDSLDVVVSDGKLRPVHSMEEKTLCRVWATVLDVSESCLSLQSDFFEVGGHSLLAARLVSSIREAFDGLAITLSDVIRFSQLGAMCARIMQLRTGGEDQPIVDTKIDLPLEALLDVAIYPAPTRKSGYSRFRVEMVSMIPRHVFLTGATGFLGIHLILSILKHSAHAVVYCLIRAATEEEALDRISKQAKAFGLDQSLDLDRIVPVLGDLSKPNLGLDFNAFKVLAGEIDSIIHNGAAVNLVKSYGALKATNVLGTQEILRLAVTNGFSTTRVKPVHFVSTNGVFSTDTKFMTEMSVAGDWESLTGGYSQSKWVAEQMCLEARKRGLPVSILRPGNMSPCSTTGIWNNSDFVYLLLSGCKKLDAFPKDVNWFFDLTPVDFAADAIVHFAVQAPAQALGQIVHIQNHHGVVASDEFFASVSRTVPTMSGVTFQEWKKLLKTQAAVSSGNLLRSLEAGLESFTYYLQSDAVFDCKVASSMLHPADIKCPHIDQNLVSTYMQNIL